MWGDAASAMELKEKGHYWDHEYGSLLAECSPEGAFKDVPVRSGTRYRLTSYGDERMYFILEDEPGTGTAQDRTAPPPDHADARPVRRVRDMEYYDALRVPSNATAEEIKRAYRRRALATHPDKNRNNPAADNEFKQVSAAYAVLSDDFKRDMYDRVGVSGLNTATASKDVLITRLFGDGAFDHVFGHAQDLFAEEPAKDVIQELADHLAKSLEGYVVNEKMWLQRLDQEIATMAQASGGVRIMQHVGYVYEQESRKFSQRHCCMVRTFEHRRQNCYEAGATVAVYERICSVCTRAVWQEIKKNADEEDLLRGHISQSQHQELQKHRDAKDVEIARDGLGAFFDYGCLKIQMQSREVVQVLLRRVGGSKRERFLEGLDRLGRAFTDGSKKYQSDGLLFENFTQGLNLFDGSAA